MSTSLQKDMFDILFYLDQMNIWVIKINVIYLKKKLFVFIYNPYRLMNVLSAKLNDKIKTFLD